MVVMLGATLSFFDGRWGSDRAVHLFMATVSVMAWAFPLWLICILHVFFQYVAMCLLTSLSIWSLLRLLECSALGAPLMSVGVGMGCSRCVGFLVIFSTLEKGMFGDWRATSFLVASQCSSQESLEWIPLWFRLKRNRPLWWTSLE